MNLPEIFVQFLKVTVSLPNDYLKQRKGREVLVRFIVPIASHHKYISKQIRPLPSANMFNKNIQSELPTVTTIKKNGHYLSSTPILTNKTTAYRKKY